MATEGEINVSRIEPVSRNDRERAEQRERGKQSLLHDSAIAGETAFEFEATTFDAEPGVLLSGEVFVKTPSPGVGSIVNHVRDGNDPDFGVTLTILSGDGFFLTEAGRATSVVLKGFKNGRAKFALIADVEGTVDLGLIDSESTGLAVTSTAAVTVAQPV